MLEINSDIPNIYEFTNIDSLKDMNLRRKLWNGAIKEIEEAIDCLPIENSDREKIYNKNIINLLK